MPMSAVEFLTFATKIIPEYTGLAQDLKSFEDALNLVNESVDTHVAQAINLIKTKLKGTARDYVTNEATIPEIIARQRTQQDPS